MLAERFRHQGHPVDVTNAGRWLQLVHTCFRRLEHDVLAAQPDVVVVHVGYLESQSAVPPLWLIRYLFTWRARSHAVPLAIRRTIAPRLGRLYHHYTPAVTRRIPNSRRLSVPRFELELDRIIRLLRKDRRALVLVCTAGPTSPRVSDVFFDLDRRMADTNDAIRRVVDRMAEPDVRVVDVADLVARGGVDKLLPDGIHLSADGHEQVADLLEAEIAPWFDELLRRRGARADDLA